MIRRLRSFAIGAVCAFVIAIGIQPVYAAEYEWRFAHYLQEEHFFAAGWLSDWVDELERRSDGRIRVKVYPNNSLLRLAAIAPGVRDGQAEIGFGPAPQSPVLDLIELPFIANSATHGTEIVMSMFQSNELLAKDLEGLHVAVLQTNAPSLIHTKDKLVRVPKDFSGLKMRGATDYVREILSTLGSEPVAGYLAPQVFGLLRDGTVDGTIWPYEAIRIFNLGEQTNHHTEMYFFVSVLGLFVNSAALDSLPDELQSVVHDMSGRAIAVSAATEWDLEEKRGRDIVKELGNTITIPTENERAAWRTAAQPLIDRKLKELSDQGIDASGQYKDVLLLSNTLAKQSD